MSRTPLVEAGPRLEARAAAERQGRWRSRVRRTGIALGVVVPLAVLAWVLLGSPLLAVRTVEVVGEHRLRAAEVVGAADVRAGTPLARVDTAAVVRRVEQLAPVAHVSVTRAWPHTLTITVVERVPVVALAQDGTYGLLDRDGVEVARVASAPRGLYRLTSSSPDATAAALAVLDHLPRSITGRLGSLRAPSPDQVTLVLRDRRQVLWGGPEDGATKASAVLALLRLPGTVYDVSAPGVASRR